MVLPEILCDVHNRHMITDLGAECHRHWYMHVRDAPGGEGGAIIACHGLGAQRSTKQPQGAASTRLKRTGGYTYTSDNY